MTLTDNKLKSLISTAENRIWNTWPIKKALKQLAEKAYELGKRERIKQKEKTDEAV